MRLEFEQWVSSQHMSETAEDLFQEAIVCYKASAYRAALLLSYLGFQTIIKDRILASRRPAGINEALWDAITNKLTDDSTWDSQAFDTTQMKSPAPIFTLSDDLRRQVTYWKDRRNDCAHSRRNEISFSHVEAFWLFLRSNLPKFAVSGSKEGLLSDLRVHSDRSLTPADADYSQIIEQIRYAVETEELQEFFEGVHEVFTELHRRPPGATFYPSDEVMFFDSVLDTGISSVTSELVSFLRSREDLLVEVLRFNPARVSFVVDRPTLVRKLWYEQLLPTRQRDFEIYCSLLRNRLIPEDQVQEAHRRIIPFLSNVAPPEECYSLLQDTGFFDVFRQVVFLRSDSPSEAPLADQFGWANSNLHFVIQYLSRFGIDEQIAHSLSRIFGKENHPYDLRDAINVFLQRNVEKRSEFLRVFDDNGIPVPSPLQLQGGED